LEKRSGVFLVKTDWWYIERLVWLIAGTDVVLSSILTVVHNPNWAFSILFVGFCSIMVATTGFCIVGNILYFLGVRPLVPDKRTYDQGKWNGFVFLWRTMSGSWSVILRLRRREPVHQLNAGEVLQPYWLYFTGFVGTATILFAFTGFCIMANFLYRLGLEPRMCRYI